MDQKEFMNIQRNRPHLVILGAGASIATIPKGDKNGRKLACMNNFISEMDLDEIFVKYKYKTDKNNLEDIYSELYDIPDCKPIREELEIKIIEKLKSLQLPDKMTIYDYLIISLRKKDLIASFNWDPLLIEAYGRMKKITNDLPELVFLHGNVLAGYCKKCKSFGHISNSCQICKQKYIQSKLLFPIKEKNYENDLFISEQWKRVKKYITKATIVTFFGYSAPKTDKAAIDILKNLYNDGPLHRFDTIEIIDIKDKQVLDETWADFIQVGGANQPHYLSSFYDSIIAEFPRRTIEGYSERNFNGWWGDGKHRIFEKEQTIDEFKSFISPIIERDKLNDFSVK